MPRCASLAAAHTIAAWLPSVGVLHLGDGWLTAQLCKNGSLQAALRDGDLVVKKVGPVCSQYLQPISPSPLVPQFHRSCAIIIK